LTQRTFDRLRGLTERASYDLATGSALRELTAETAAKAGWLSFDARRHDDARRWWLEAAAWSKFTDDDDVSTLALASMARQAADEGRPRESIDLTASARRSAGRAATPRLTSMLHAREALGHAGTGDRASARTALRRARAHVETRHDGDPQWLDFYGPADHAAHERRCVLALGDTAAAEDAARTSHALCDPIAYPRNATIAMIELADLLAQRGEIDESATVATRAAGAAAELDSGRVTRGLRNVAKRLEPHRDNADVGAFLAMV
jgi:hypothetical protein